MSPVMTAFSSLPPLPSACMCPTTPCALFLPTSHPHYGWQGPIEWLQAPSGEFPLFGPLFANNPLPSPHTSPLALVNTHQGKARVLFPPHAMLAALTQPCTPHFKPCQPPPHKCNPQINPAPRINHPCQWNQWEVWCTRKGGSVRRVDWTGAWTTPKQHTHTLLKTLTHFHPLYVRGASSSGFSRY